MGYTGQEYAPVVRRMPRIPGGNCYGWDACTAALYRGRGLAAWLLEWTSWRMAESGLDTMWNGILDENLAGRRPHP